MLDELFALLETRRSTQGKVTRIDDAGIWVTVGGRAMVARQQAGDATVYRPGDAVRLAGDVIIARIARRAVRRYVV